VGRGDSRVTDDSVGSPGEPSHPPTAAEEAAVTTDDDTDVSGSLQVSLGSDEVFLDDEQDDQVDEFNRAIDILHNIARLLEETASALRSSR